MTNTKLDNEALQATNLLEGKVVSKIIRNNNKEVIIEYTDGSRLIIDSSESGLELSITGE